MERNVEDKDNFVIGAKTINLTILTFVITCSHKESLVTEQVQGRKFSGIVMDLEQSVSAYALHYRNNLHLLNHLCNDISVTNVITSKPILYTYIICAYVCIYTIM